MSKIALFSRQDDIIRAAILHEDQIIHLDGDRLDRTNRYGDVCKGKVCHIERGQLWVDLQSETGLMSLGKMTSPYTLGQQIAVQVIRESFYDVAQSKFKSPLVSDNLAKKILPWFFHLIPDWSNLTEIVCDDAEFLSMIKPQVKNLYPKLTFQLSHSNCFKSFNVEEEWDNLFLEKIQLPGGNFTLEETSAATIIDVNGSGPIGPLNLQTAEMIANQIKWRSLSGAIMIEFINHGMNQRQEIIEILKNNLPLTYTIHGFTKLGFTEISGSKARAPLSHRLIKKGRT